jgi:hypothetical protein
MLVLPPHLQGHRVHGCPNVLLQLVFKVGLFLLQLVQYISEVVDCAPRCQGYSLWQCCGRDRLTHQLLWIGT